MYAVRMQRSRELRYLCSSTCQVTCQFFSRGKLYEQISTGQIQSLTVKHHLGNRLHLHQRRTRNDTTKRLTIAEGTQTLTSCLDQMNAWADKLRKDKSISRKDKSDKYFEIYKDNVQLTHRITNE